MAIKERQLEAFETVMDKIQQREDQVTQQNREALDYARDWLRSMKDE